MAEEDELFRGFLCVRDHRIGKLGRSRPRRELRAASASVRVRQARPRRGPRPRLAPSPSLLEGGPRAGRAAPPPASSPQRATSSSSTPSSSPGTTSVQVNTAAVSATSPTRSSAAMTTRSSTPSAVAPSSGDILAPTFSSLAPPTSPAAEGPVAASATSPAASSPPTSSTPPGAPLPEFVAVSSKPCIFSRDAQKVLEEMPLQRDDMLQNFLCVRGHRISKVSAKRLTYLKRKLSHNPKSSISKLLAEISSPLMMPDYVVSLAHGAFVGRLDRQKVEQGLGIQAPRQCLERYGLDRFVSPWKFSEQEEMTSKIQTGGHAFGFDVHSGLVSGLLNLGDTWHSHEFRSSSVQDYAIRGILNCNSTCYPRQDNNNLVSEKVWLCFIFWSPFHCGWVRLEQRSPWPPPVRLEKLLSMVFCGPISKWPLPIWGLVSKGKMKGLNGGISKSLILLLWHDKEKELVYVLSPSLYGTVISSTQIRLGLVLLLEAVDDLDVDTLDVVDVLIGKVQLSNKSKFLSQLFALLPDIGLNIRESIVFSTANDYSFDVLDIDTRLLKSVEQIASGSCEDIFLGTYGAEEVAVKILLLDKDHVVKVADFGICCFQDEGGAMIWMASEAAVV